MNDGVKRTQAIEAFLKLSPEEQEAIRTAEKSPMLEKLEARKGGTRGKYKRAALRDRQALARHLYSNVSRVFRG